MRLHLFIIAAIAAICLGGCSDEQLGRAESYAGTAHAALDAATANIDALQAQLDAAKKALAETGDARISAVVDQLAAGLTVAKRALPAIQVAAAQADTALAALKEQAAQGVVPWWQVALGIAVPILLPLAKTIPVVGPLVGQIGELAWSAYATHQQKTQQQSIEKRAVALDQTVAGIEAAKEKLPPDAVDTLHAELAAAQDQSVKTTVAVVKATSAVAA